MAHERLKKHLRGVAFTTPTPFTEDGSEVSVPHLQRIVDFLTDAGARNLIPCGNTGEYYSLSNEERITVVEETVERSPSGTSVVGGVGGSTKTAQKLLSAYESAGADGAMLMQPGHTYVHPEGILEYYTELVESTSLGIVLYKRGPRLSHDVIEQLVSFENVVGVKYAVNDIKGFSTAVRSIDGDVVWSNGIAERFAPAYALEGAEGFTSGIGNFLPEEVLSLMDALREEQWNRAIAIRNLLQPYEDLREEPGPGNSYVSGNNVPGVKHGMELAGLYGGPVREPIVDLSEEDKLRATEIYETIKRSELVP